MVAGYQSDHVACGRGGCGCGGECFLAVFFLFFFCEGGGGRGGKKGMGLMGWQIALIVVASRMRN